MAPANAKRWGPEDDQKLLALFKKGTNNGGLDPTKTDLKSCKYAWERHFTGNYPEYKNFGPLYRRKANDFCLAQDLEGARKRESLLLLYTP